MQHLYVTNLTPRWTHESLLQLFSQFGEVLDLTWTLASGCAFIEYSDPREAELAVKELDGKEFYNRNISVIQAEKPQRSSPRTKTSVSSGTQQQQQLEHAEVAAADSSSFAHGVKAGAPYSGGYAQDGSSAAGGGSGADADGKQQQQQQLHTTHNATSSASGTGGAGAPTNGLSLFTSSSSAFSRPDATSLSRASSGQQEQETQDERQAGGHHGDQDEQHVQKDRRHHHANDHVTQHTNGSSSSTTTGSGAGGELWSPGSGHYGGNHAYQAATDVNGHAESNQMTSPGEPSRLPLPQSHYSQPSSTRGGGSGGGGGGGEGYGVFENMQQHMEGALPGGNAGNNRMDRPRHVTLDYNQQGPAFGYLDYPGGYQGGGDQGMQYEQQQQHAHPYQQPQSQHHHQQHHSSHHQQQQHQQQQQQHQFGPPPPGQQPQAMHDFHAMQAGFDGYNQSNYHAMGGSGGGFLGNGGYGNQMGRGGGGGLGRAGSVSSTGPLGGGGGGGGMGMPGGGPGSAGSPVGGGPGGQGAGHSHCDFPLRILVPSEMIGAIIGKEGHTIRAITEHTGARVDVHRKENPGAAEKAITIIGTPDACSAASKSIADIMQKEAMTNSSFHTDKCQGPHGNLPCIPLKILAHNNLVGRVIGKNGNTLKKIMSESDTKITISKLSELTTANMERTITVVGTIVCSSKAEALISMKLRASYECDMNHLIPQQHPLPSPMYPSQAGSMRASSSTPVSPGLMSPGMVIDGFSDEGFLQSPVTGSQVEIVHLAVPSHAVGAIIGTKGKEIRNISQLSGATLRISRSCDDSTERIVTIQGNQEAQWAAQNCIYNKVREECSPNQAGGDEDRNMLRVELTVPADTVGRIIGKGGTAVRELQRKTGAMVEVPRGQQSENVTVRILGNFHSSQVAQRHIKEIVSQAQHQQEQQQQQQDQMQPTPAAGTAVAGALAAQTSPLAQTLAQGHGLHQPPQSQQQPAHHQTAAQFPTQYFTFPQSQSQPPPPQQQQQQQHMSWQPQAW